MKILILLAFIFGANCNNKITINTEKNRCVLDENIFLENISSDFFGEKSFVYNEYLKSKYDIEIIKYSYGQKNELIRVSFTDSSCIYRKYEKDSIIRHIIHNVYIKEKIKILNLGNFAFTCDLGVFNSKTNYYEIKRDAQVIVRFLLEGGDYTSLPSEEKLNPYIYFMKWINDISNGT